MGGQQGTQPMSSPRRLRGRGGLAAGRIQVTGTQARPRYSLGRSARVQGRDRRCCFTRCRMSCITDRASRPAMAASSGAS
jgi:hypothetical protein